VRENSGVDDRGGALGVLRESVDDFYCGHDNTTRGSMGVGERGRERGRAARAAPLAPAARRRRAARSTVDWPKHRQ